MAMNPKPMQRLVLLPMALLILLPIAWMLLSSFKPSAQVTAYPPRLWFGPTLENYRTLFAGTPFLRYTWNSTAITAGSTAIGLLLGTAGGLPRALGPHTPPPPPR